MSIYNPPGYLAQPLKTLGSELIGFNRRTGQPVQAAAGLGMFPSAVGSPDGLGSYLDLTPDFYKTFQHDNWQHPGSSEWSSANVPGWGENPNLQMFARRGVGEDTAGNSKMLFGVAAGVLLAVFALRFVR